MSSWKHYGESLDRGKKEPLKEEADIPKPKPRPRRKLITMQDLNDYLEEKKNEVHKRT